MKIQVIEKGAVFELQVESKNKGSFYFGAGWDNPNGPVDLDIVCALLVDGKITRQNDFVYFSNRSAKGVMLSEDNQTGEGEGDDESIVIDPSLLDPSITEIAIGLATYAGADLHSAPNPHFRVCDGKNEDDEQIADIPVQSEAVEGNTVLVAFKLVKGSDGWDLVNIGDLHSMGTGRDAIKGFSSLFA